jgi:ABC-type Fe3+-hydroxamate transport system substrate-binding protein
MRGPLTLLASALLLAMFAVACGFKSEPTGASPTYPVNVVDGAGRDVSVPARPTRIVSLDPGLTESLAAVGAEGLVVGRSGEERYPASSRQAPVVMTNGAPDDAKITALNPSLVLAPSTTSPSQASAMAGRLGAPVYVAGAPSVRGVEHDILSVAALVGLADNGHDVIGRIRSQIARIAALTKSAPRERVFVDLGGRMTIDPHGMGATLLDLAGAANAAPNASPGTAYPLARLRQAAPAWYLATRGATTLHALRRSKATRDLPAVRDGRFHPIPVGLMTDTGPGIASSLTTLVRILHPELAVSQGQ